jgi:hypothetical protein
MRLDPTQSDPLRHLGGGAVDASIGQENARQSEEAAKESQYESLDALMLRRMRAAQVTDAASSVSSASDAQEMAQRTRQLMTDDTHAARMAQGHLVRDHLRKLLGGGN